MLSIFALSRRAFVRRSRTWDGSMWWSTYYHTRSERRRREQARDRASGKQTL